MVQGSVFDNVLIFVLLEEDCCFLSDKHNIIFGWDFTAASLVLEIVLVTA